MPKPRKSKGEDDPLEIFGRALLAALQMTSMAMCALIIYEMLLTDALKIPYQACIESVPANTP